MLNLALGVSPVSTRQRVGSIISELFRKGEAGVWFDPSDSTTVFQDSAGTTKGALEQPVGLILDKSQGLKRGPEVCSSASVWTTQNPSNVTFVSGSEIELRADATGVWKDLFVGGLNTSFSYEVSLTVNEISGSDVYLQYLDAADAAKTLGVRGTSGVLRGIFTGGKTLKIAATPDFVGTLTGVTLRTLAGNHASQSTAAARPVLSARVNLLVRTENIADAAWSKAEGTVSGTDLFIPNTVSAIHRIFTAVSRPAAGMKVSFRGRLKSEGVRYVYVNADASSAARLTIDLDTGNYSSGGSSISNIKVSRGADGWVDYEFTGVTTAAGDTVYYIQANTALTVTDSTYAGDGLAGFRSTAHQYEFSDKPTRYQRVNTATDYDSAGFPRYLKFDGVDDGLVVSSLNLSSTDKLTAFSATRRQASGNSGVLFEHSVNFNNNGGAFGVFMDEGAEGVTWTLSTGAGYRRRKTPASAIGSLNVLTFSLDRSRGVGPDMPSMRRNGGRVQSTSTHSSSSASNLLDRPLYIGYRHDQGGVPSFYNKTDFYGLVIRGASTSTRTLKATEKTLADSMRSTVPDVNWTPEHLFKNGEAGALYLPELPDVRRNLLVWTENLLNSWASQNASNIVVSATKAPNGGAAYEVTAPAAAYTAVRQEVAVKPGTTYTFSRYVLAGSSTPLSIRIHNVTSGTDIVGGAATTVPASGWDRQSVTFTTPANCVRASVYIISADATAGAKWTVSEPQLELGTSATSYQRVTDWTSDILGYAGSHRINVFQDSAGTQPVTAMEQPVGLLLDQSKGSVRGDNVVANGTFDSGMASWSQANGGGVYVSGGELRVPAGHSAYHDVSVTAGQSFVVTADLRMVTGTKGITLIVYDGAAFTTNIGQIGLGVKQVIVRPTQNTIRLYAYSNSSVADGEGAFDNITARALPGAHASQSTAAARPVISARKNLLTKTENFADAAWASAVSVGCTITKTDTTAYSDPLGGMGGRRITVNRAASTELAMVTQKIATVATDYQSTLYLKAFAAGDVGKKIDLWYFDGAVKGVTTHTLTADWVRVQMPKLALVGSAGAEVLSFGYLDTAAGGGQIGTTDFLAFGAQCELGEATAYQYVNTSTDYAWQGFPQYLRFDGVDDKLVAKISGLGSSMDAYMAFNRGSANQMLMLYGTDGGSAYAGVAEVTSTAEAEANAGAGTYTVNAVAVPGGTITTRDQFNTALKVGAHSIVGMLGMDMTNAWWSGISIGGYSGWPLNGNLYGLSVNPAKTATERTLLEDSLANKQGTIL